LAGAVACVSCLRVYCRLVEVLEDAAAADMS